MNTTDTDDILSTSPKDKTDLLERIQLEWSALLKDIDKLSPEQMNRPGAGGWSVKDNLAHLAAWEQFMLRHHIQGHPPHQVMQVDEATMERVDEDGLNAIIFERNRNRPAEDVLNDLKSSHEQVLATLTGMTFADLMKPHYADDPLKRPVIEWVIGNTYSHYREHRLNIQAVANSPRL